LLVFVFLLVLGGLTGNNFQRISVVVWIFVTVIFLGFAWEYAELRLDIISGSTYFVNPYDSIFDMIFNIIATSYVAINVGEYLKRESLLSLYMRWIHWREDVR
jgi:hypothetical protein